MSEKHIVQMNMGEQVHAGHHDHGHNHEHSNVHDHGHNQECSHPHVHTHVLEDGTVIEHTHGESGHHHSHAHTKSVLNRLAKASGHMKAICRMVEDGRSVQEILPQLMAVKSAINNTGKIILEDHIKHCVGEAVEENDTQSITELKRAIRKFSR